MSKWAIGFVAVLLACLPIWFHRASDPSLLQDTDTKVLLQAIRARQAPLSWFAGDWPLGNHFYRPVSTLSFELDNAVGGDDAAVYGRTNALLAIACVLALFWFLRELTDRLDLALPGALLFAIWNVGATGWATVVCHWLGWAALLWALVPGRKTWPAVMAKFCFVFVAWELPGMMSLEFRIIDWLPGRTASVMTLFALLSLGVYARYERLSAVRRTAPATPLDLPATKGTVAIRPLRFPVIWAFGSVLALALALGSYEQAVILPGLLFGVALAFGLRGYRVRWGWQAAFWGLLLGYLFLRSRLVPSDVSGYQAQQFRSGPGVVDSLLSYFLPAWGPFWALAQTVDVGPLIWMSPSPWIAMSNVVSNAAIVVAARKEWLFLLAGWAMSFVAFLPMAWLKHFDHYHYLPMAMRSLFVAAALGIAVRAWLTAASRPALPAPPRLDPAPGSLPHR